MSTRIVCALSRNTPYDLYIGPKSGRFRESQYSVKSITGTSYPNNDAAILGYWDFLMSEKGRAIRDKIRDPNGEIKGKRLACLCGANKICHGDVLAYIADGIFTERLGEFLIRKNRISAGYEILPRKENYLEYHRVRGAFFGMMLGDALGGPHEMAHFNEPPRELPAYTGELTIPHTTESGVPLPPGAISDFTETTIVMARHLIQNRQYDVKKCMESLIEWERSDPPMFGDDMRKLLTGTEEPHLTTVPTYQDYTTRYAQMFKIPFLDTTRESPETKITEYHSAVIRSLPLACLSGKSGSNSLNTDAIRTDVWATNPSELFFKCESLYLTCLKLAMMGHSATAIWDYVKTLEEAQDSKIQRVFTSLEAGEIWDVKGPEFPNKCYILLTFYAAMIGLYLKMTTQAKIKEIIDTIIVEFRDTDADSAIAGAILGAIEGYDEVEAFNAQSINTILSANRSLAKIRPALYRLDDIDTVIDELYNLGSE